MTTRDRTFSEPTPNVQFLRADGKVIILDFDTSIEGLCSHTLVLLIFSIHSNTYALYSCFSAVFAVSRLGMRRLQRDKRPLCLSL